MGRGANRVRAIEVLIAHGADLKATSKVENVPLKEAADRAATQKRRAANPDLPAYLAGGGRGNAAGGGRGAVPAERRTAGDSTAAPDSTVTRRNAKPAAPQEPLAAARAAQHAGRGATGARPAAAVAVAGRTISMATRVD